MSRRGSLYHCQSPSFPRVSGDEPTLVETLDELPEFSPRERG